MTAPDVRGLPEPPHAPGQGAAPDAKSERPSAATRLIELALRRYRLGVTPEGDPFAMVQGGSAHIALPLRGGRLGLRAALARDYYEAEAKAAGQQALADALVTLEGLAQDLDASELHLRVAEHESALWIDMGDTAAHALRVDGVGWNVEQTAPVLFQRTELTAPLVMPARGGDVHRLFEFMNVDPPDRPLLLAALVASYLPDIPHPIPTLAGEQGTGKSTAARMLVALTDPSTVPLRKAPRDADSLVTAFRGSWVVAVDNLSAVTEWLSDSLCRAVTGEGDVRRTLYTDGGLSVFSFRRQIILTGIDFAGLRGDLTERMLLVHLRRIVDADRVDDRALWRRWDDALPGILGGLLDLLAQVLARLPGVHLDRMPRMADFARVLAAVDEVLGTTGLARYAEQATELAADTLAASPFVERLLSLGSFEFSGTAAALLTRVTPPEPDWKAPRDWPKNGRAVTTVLKRDAPALRKQGWAADEIGEDRNHTRLWFVASPDRQDDPEEVDLFGPDEPF